MIQATKNKNEPFSIKDNTSTNPFILLKMLLALFSKFQLTFQWARFISLSN
jgi:hypothetical protein